MSDYENDAYKAALYGRATEEQQRSIAAGVALRQAELATLRATIARIEGEKADLERHLEELREKFAAPVCACSYDYPGDVCMAHSPLLKKALSEKEALEADKAKLREAVLEEAAKRLDREWPGPASSIVRALAETAIKSIEDKDTNG